MGIRSATQFDMATVRVRSLVRWCSTLAATVALAVVLAACSGSFSFSLGGQTPSQAAVDLIESEEMALRLGVPSIMDATCDEPAVVDVGETFACQGLSNGQVVNFEVLIESEDEIFAGPTNVVARTDVAGYAESAADVLAQSSGVDLAASAMDCGSNSVILDDDNVMMCTLTDPAGVSYDAAITIRDVELGTFNVEVLGTQ